ncbi:P27 family phage terminase small subunit [Alkalihalobacillus sp. NPDC078783]
MAKILRSTLRKRIENDLTSQLNDKKIVGNHYSDLIQDYLSLWDLKCDLIDEIEENGIQIMGMHGPKSNPSINDLHKTNDRMLKILDSIGLKAAAAEEDKNKKHQGTADDLI